MKYLVFDGRFHNNPDDAVVLACCESLKEAEIERDYFGEDCVIEENSIQPDGKTLISTGKTW